MRTFSAKRPAPASSEPPSKAKAFSIDHEQVENKKIHNCTSTSSVKKEGEGNVIDKKYIQTGMLLTTPTASSSNFGSSGEAVADAQIQCRLCRMVYNCMDPRDGQLHSRYHDRFIKNYAWRDISSLIPSTDKAAAGVKRGVSLLEELFVPFNRCRFFRTTAAYDPSKRTHSKV